LRETYLTLAPVVEIIPYGVLKKYKPRADYVAGVLAVAGIEAKVVDGFQSVEDMAHYVSSTNAHYAVIVATDEDTIEIVPTIAAAKKEALILDVAGKFKEQQQQWQENGINGFIFAGQNIVEKLTQIAQAVEEA
jgi:methylmalonyl-CoA mutase